MQVQEVLCTAYLRVTWGTRSSCLCERAHLQHHRGGRTWPRSAGAAQLQPGSSAQEALCINESCCRNVLAFPLEIILFIKTS